MLTPRFRDGQRSAGIRGAPRRLALRYHPARLMAPDEKDIWGRWAAPGEHPGAEERPFTVSDYSSTPRESTRVPLAHRIQLKFDRFSGFIDEYIANISPGGIFIRTESPEEPGQLLEFEFRLGDGFELIRGRGEVVWTRHEAEGAARPKGMGVRFLDLSPGSKDLIYKIVDDFVAHGGKPFDLTAPAAAENQLSADATMPLAAGAPGAAPPPQDLPDLPWPLDLPAIRPVPGIPAITPRSPLELLGSASAPPLAPPAEEAAAEGPEDPLEQILASLPPLDDLAPSSPEGAAPPAAGLAPPAPPVSSLATSQAPPALPFSAFDLRAPRRRSRLPLIGALLAVALLGLGVYLMRDNVLAWLDRGETAAGPPARVAARTPPGSGLPARGRRAAASPPGDLAGPTGSTSGASGAAAPPPGSRAFRADVAAPAGAAPPAGSPAGGVPRAVPSTGAAASPSAAGPQGAAPARRATLGAALPSAGAAVAATQAPGAAANPPATGNPPPAAAEAGAPPPLVTARPEGQSGQSGVAPSPAGTAPARLTALERITWEPAHGGPGTDVVLWGNGDFTPQSYTRSRVGGVAGLPVREVVRLHGITSAFRQARLAVGTAEVTQIRTGAHPHDELHVVLDLTGPGVKVTGVDAGSRQLRFHLSGAAAAH